MVEFNVTNLKRSMKIICAGAPKTGTKSFARALRTLGYDKVYDSPEAVEFGFKEWEDVFAKRVTDLNVLFDTVYSEVDAVVDLPHSYFFDTFLERWPDAKGIAIPHPLFWKHWYRRHNAYVRSVVPKSQLLEYRVTEGWEPLCKFLEKPVPKEIFPYENKAADQHNISDIMLQDTWIAKKAAREIKMCLTLFPIAISLLIAYVYFYCL